MNNRRANAELKVAVVIPCFQVKQHIIQVLEKIGPEVWRIYVVDDCCTESSGDYVITNCADHRVVVIKNETNLGVGGAVLNGYIEAIKDGAKIIVKLDGDGQMDPALIFRFIRPIAEGRADYTKGNRFFYLDEIGRMPKVRIVGNSVLSFMSKVSTGYWGIFDPTNGYTAIHAGVAKYLPYEKISKGYLFETDILFRLNTLKAKVTDIPMNAEYGDEKSNLRILKLLFPFLFLHLRNLSKRIFYNYFLRDLNLASIELVTGTAMLFFGLIYGINAWLYALRMDIGTPAGTVMLSALPIIVGLQLLLNFLSYDIYSQPSNAIHHEIDDY